MCYKAANSVMTLAKFRSSYFINRLTAVSEVTGFSNRWQSISENI